MSDYEIYCEQRAEAKACGYEFPPFDEWLEPKLTRQRAEARLPRSLEELDDPAFDDDMI